MKVRLAGPAQVTTTQTEAPRWLRRQLFTANHASVHLISSALCRAGGCIGAAQRALDPGSAARDRYARSDSIRCPHMWTRFGRMWAGAPDGSSQRAESASVLSMAVGAVELVASPTLQAGKTIDGSKIFDPDLIR